jgi:hypothetical protein
MINMVAMQRLSLAFDSMVMSVGISYKGVLLQVPVFERPTV